MQVRALLIRGMLVGLLAGVLVFSVAKLFGEPQVDRAIAFESAMDAAQVRADLARGIHDVPEPELVSRANQASWGLLTGVLTYATAFGGLFALVFAYAYGRVDELGPRATSALLGLIGMVSLYVVPNLKYPANPPSVGHPDTIGLRTGLYFAMMAISVAAAVGGLVLRKRLLARLDAWSAALVAVAAYLAVVIAAGLLLPPIDEVPASFPATLLWRFRVDSFGMQAVMWAIFGLGFGAVVEHGQIGRLWRLSSRSRPAWH